MFSAEHIIALLVLFMSYIILIAWFLKSKNKKSIQHFMYFLAGFFLFNELAYTAWSIYAGIWSVAYSLPLQLCDAAAFLSAVMFLSNSYRIFEIVYFWGLGGSLQALLTPDLYYPFPHFVYFNFFLGHGAILIAIFYIVTVKKYKPTLKSILNVFIITNVYAAAISLINLLTGGNYMFTCRKPQGISLLSFLSPWPWYILSLEAVALIIYFLLYLPFAIWSKRKGQYTDLPKNSFLQG